ncbi:alpha/beta hydrolase family protein [Chitinophaga lutea]
MKRIISWIVPVLLAFHAMAQDKALTPAQEMELARTNAYADQLEKYLRGYLVDQYAARAGKAWNRDYSSPQALERSVEPNRRRWEEKVIKPPVLQKTGALQRTPYLLEGVEAEWIELPLGPLTAQAVLAFPKNMQKGKKLPVVIVQHGIGSSPETPFRDGNYHAYAKGLLDAGFAVVVPMNLRSIERRNRIERLTRLADISLPGIEFARLQHLLDIVLADPRVDPEKVGMWGVSLGGMATMFFMPLEPRIKAGVVSAWFNQRLNKMVLKDERYSCFLETTEDHAFFTGWLTEFTDHDVVSLIAPRPLMVQHGKKDGIAWWPQVEQEFAQSRVHYEKLGMPERIALTLHDGGHEAIVDAGVSFLQRWLR